MQRSDCTARLWRCINSRSGQTIAGLIVPEAAAWYPFAKAIPTMLLIPILIPLIGAGFVFLSRNQSARVRWLVFLASSVAAWLIAGAMRIFIPVAQELSVWQPQEVFETPLTLRLDDVSWIAIVACATLLLSVALTSESREGEGQTGMRVLLLVYAGFSIMALMGGDLVALGLGWVLTDLVGFGFLIASSRQDEAVSTLATRAGVLLTSSLLVLAGAALEAGSQEPSEAAVWLWLAAVLLRIGLVPLHVSLPSHVGVRRGLGALLRLQPPAMAIILLARSPSYSPAEPVIILLLLISGLGALAGGMRWGLHEDAVEGRPFFVLGLTALSPLFLILGEGNSSAGLAGLIALLILGGGSISIYQSHVPWHKIWPVMLSILILGPPYSAGAWIHEALVSSGAPSPARWPAVGIMALALTTLAIGTFRLSREPETTWVSGEDAVRATYTIGQSLPLAMIVVMGVVAGWEFTVNSVVTFGALLIVTFSAVFILRRTVGTHRRAILGRMSESLEFGGIYRWTWGGARYLGRMVRTLGAVFEGRSAILWVLVILMMVGLLMSDGGP